MSIFPLQEAIHQMAKASQDVQAARADYDAEVQAAWDRYVSKVDRVLAADLVLPVDDDEG